MRILFLSKDIPSFALERSSFYGDFIRGLASCGHQLTVLAPQNPGESVGCFQEGSIKCIRVKLGSFRGAIPFWKKAYNITLMSLRYRNAYRQYLKTDEFDIVMLATPPVTLDGVVKLVKRESKAKFYLILRDIHPECLVRHEVSKEILSRTDVYKECKKVYKANFVLREYLHYHAQKLYHQADWIGCMSPANQSYMKSIAPYVPVEKIVLLPNWYKGIEYNSKTDVQQVRIKYGLEDKIVAIFGGTIGDAQAIWNIATLARHFIDDKRVMFIVAGRGTHRQLLKELAVQDHLSNMCFMDYMPREDYEELLASADIGLISIDEKYAVPTCPSKIIGYMALAKPVVAMFNSGNDFGEYYIDRAQCGFWSVGMDNDKMFDNFKRLLDDRELRVQLGMNGYEYYKKYLAVEVICKEFTRQILDC